MSAKEMKNNRKSTKKDKDKNEFENTRKKVNFYLITSLVTNEKYKESFDLQLDQNPNYTIKELKNTISPEEIERNNIIKVKNFFSSLLYNYRSLIKTDFEPGTTTNTENILKNLKIYLKSSNFVVDDSIPSEWYVDSLLEYLGKIPEDLAKNDYQKLYDEIEEALNKSINKFDFQAISVCLDKLKFTKRGKIFYEEAIKSTRDLELNEKVQDIIEDDYIPVEIIFRKNENVFDIVKSKMKEKDYIKKHNQEKMKNFCNNTIFCVCPAQSN